MNTFLSSIRRVRGCLNKRMLIKDNLHPERVQKKLLSRLLKENAQTKFGKEHAFSSITNEKNYQNNVPITEYADIESSVDMIKMGHSNILTRNPVLMFNLSSGTSSRPKYIPVTRNGSERTGQLTRQWLFNALTDHPKMLDRSFLIIMGAPIEGHCDSGIPYGNASGMIYNTLPPALKNSLAAPSAISAIKDYDLRYYLLARFAFEKSISLIATPNPLTLVNLAETATNEQEEIIRSIHNGWLSESLQNERQCKDLGLPSDLVSSLKANKKRAAFLEKIVERTGELSPVDCWPDLKLIACWLGASIGFHADKLKRHFGDTPKRDIGYMASEGCFNLPIGDESPAGILALRNNYYEFIPEKQWDSQRPDILSPRDLKVGDSYKIILSNENGLYRYDIKDIVKVEGFHNRTPVISFSRKSGDFLNMVGEKLHLNHCLSAIDKIQTEFSLEIRKFRIAPAIKDLRYEFFIDFKSKVTETFIREKFLRTLDAELGKENLEYSSKRKSKRLNRPCIHVMGSGWEDEIENDRAKQRRSDVQFKWKQLANEKSELDNRHIKQTIEYRD